MMLFVADVHIRPDHAEDVHKFMRWVKTVLARGHRIYILGDLFDYWYTGIEKGLPGLMDTLTSQNIFILPGNRDFLLRNMVSQGLNILREEEIMSAPSGEKILLAHGHTLTENDMGFRVLHSLGWPILTLLDRIVSAQLKNRLARFLVSSSAVIRPPHATILPEIADSRGVARVICGHLHRLSMGERLIVLPAFCDTGAWLVWDKQGIRMESV